MGGCREEGDEEEVGDAAIDRKSLPFGTLGSKCLGLEGDGDLVGYLRCMSMPSGLTLSWDMNTHLRWISTKSCLVE